MNDEILSFVKWKLGIKSDKRDELLKALVKATIAELTGRYGIKLDLNDLHEQMFVADFVVWKYERNPIIPRRLQFELHNLKMK